MKATLNELRKIVKSVLKEWRDEGDYTSMSKEEAIEVLMPMLKKLLMEGNQEAIEFVEDYLDENMFSLDSEYHEAIEVLKRNEISEGDEEVSTDPKKERNDKLNSELKYLKANALNNLFPKMKELSALLSNSNEYIFASNEAQHNYYSEILRILSSIPRTLMPIYGNCNSVISLLSNNINESKNKVLKEFNKDVKGRAEDDNIFHSKFLKYVKELNENTPKIINMFKIIFNPTLAELKEVTPKLKDQLYGLYNLIDLFSNLIGNKLKSL